MSKIMLDKERTLRLDLNAFVAFEEAAGKSVLQGGLKNPTAKDIRVLLWAALKHEDPTLTLEQVGAMITVENLAAVTEALTSLSGSKDDSPLAGSGPTANVTVPSVTTTSGDSPPDG